MLIVSIVLRFALNGQAFYYARSFYCLTLLLCFIHFTKAFYLSEKIGPKAIMMGYMVSEVSNINPKDLYMYGPYTRILATDWMPFICS